MEDLVLICKLSEIEEGVLKSFDVEGVQIMATIIEGKPVVADRICTHKTYDLTKGHYDDGYITCLLHTSVFEIETGEALNPPAVDPLTIYKVVVKENEVYIDINS